MSTTVRLSRVIYSDHIVQEASKEYQGLADIRVKVTDDCFLITFNACRYNEETTVREFENYCISLESKRPEASD